MFTIITVVSLLLQLYTQHTDYLNSLVGQDFEMVSYFSQMIFGDLRWRLEPEHIIFICGGKGVKF